MAKQICILDASCRREEILRAYKKNQKHCLRIFQRENNIFNS